jgi:tetratricopeptide (TPR) repeat protein
MKKHQCPLSSSVAASPAGRRRSCQVPTLFLRALLPALAALAALAVGAVARPAWCGAPPAAAGPSAAAPPPASPAAAAGGAGQGQGGDYEFLVANLMATDGMLPEALSAFEQAEKLSPDAAYIHLEHAELLARMAQATRQPAAQAGDLRKAAAEVDRARRLAPHNLDVERGVGLVYLELSNVDQTALPTALSALEEVHQSDPDDLQTALNLGRIYLDQQQAAKAAEVFRDVIQRSPQQRAAYALLVEALLHDGKGKEAESVLSQILEFEPAALEARLTLADLEGRRNDYAAELATLRAAPEEGRDDPRLKRQLAWAYYLTGDIDDALAAVEPLLRGVQTPPADPDDLQLVLLKGLALAAQGRNEEAGELLEKLHGVRPSDPALTTILAKVLERAGHTDQAVRVLTDLDTGLAKAGKRVEERQTRLELAQVYFDNKQWDKVGEVLQPLLRSAPTPMAPQTPPTPLAPPKTEKGEDESREPALLLAADALVQRKSYDEAQRLLQKAQTTPLSPALACKLAEVQVKGGHEAEGLRELASLGAAKEPLTALSAAETYQRLERYGDSIPVLERVLGTPGKPPAELNPAAVKAATFLLGAAYERSGKREEAIAQFRRLLAADPDNHAALNYLGYMFAERGENLREAQTLIEKAVALEPDNGAYVDSLGWVYFRLGRLEDARVALERATHLETNDGTVEEHLGDVYGALGQAAQAGAAYRRAIALETDDPSKAEQVRRKLDNLGAASRP